MSNRAYATFALLLLAPLAGCDVASDLIRVNVTGSVDVDGTAPAAYSLQLYSYNDNKAAFDTSYCFDSSDGDCYGRVKVGELNTPAQGSDGGDLPVEWDGEEFTLSDVPADLLYVLVATGDDGSVICSTDVVGFDERTKVVTAASAITLSTDEGLDTFTLPRPVRLVCDAAATEPDAPANEPGGDPGGDDIPAGDDPSASWSSFQITDKNGGAIYADATSANATADVECNSNFPSVLQVKATAADAAQDTAFLRIQFGSGDAATFRTMEVPIVGGEIDQSFSLTGGYAVVQLDFDENLDGNGESYTVSFCDRADPPAQEMLVLLSWDKDDTDVDTHIFSQGSEVAYYSLSQPWGDLDIDDVDGFGPETFTSKPGVEGNLYEVKVHYYSDHGNGSTVATARVLYYDASTGETCDITASQSMNAYEWWNVGVFGPGLACPN